MPYESLPPEKWQEAIDAVAQHGSQAAAARALGLKESTFKARYRKALKRNGVSTKSLPPRRRHLFIPDAQIKPGVPTDHVDWIAQAIVEYRPDVIVVGGDWWDLASLNSHEEPGSLPMEGARFKDDIDSGNLAFARLCKPMEEAEGKKFKGRKWTPRKVFIAGNHEDRADRIANADPKWMGHVGSHHCNVRTFEWHPFLRRVWIDGICYSHYFQNSHSKHAIGGTVDNRLNKIGCSFVQGHEQGFRYGTRITGSGATWHGIVAGSCYLHIENYRGAQGQRHWRGIIVMNEVREGEFDIMPLSMSYLCRKYAGEELLDYMQKKYPTQDWAHLQ